MEIRVNYEDNYSRYNKENAETSRIKHVPKNSKVHNRLFFSTPHAFLDENVNYHETKHTV